MAPKASLIKTGIPLGTISYFPAEHNNINNYLSLNARNHVFGVSDQVRPKPVCLAAKTS